LEFVVRLKLEMVVRVVQAHQICGLNSHNERKAPEPSAESIELCRPAVLATTRTVMQDITGTRRFSDTNLIAAIIGRLVEFLQPWCLTIIA
jgi:hypothetical protein